MWQLRHKVYFTLPDVLKDANDLPITTLTTADFDISLNDAADTNQAALVVVEHQNAIPGLYGGYFIPVANPGAWRLVIGYEATGLEAIEEFTIAAEGAVAEPGDDTSGIVTLASIKTELERRRFPSILTEDDYNGILTAALRKMDRYSSDHSYASFLTTRDTQYYYIFNPDDETTHGFAANALSIVNVWWNPDGDSISSLSIFSAGWGMLSQVLVSGESYFQNPSSWLAFKQNLDTWDAQFGSQGFEILGSVGDPSAMLRLFPTPTADNGRVVVEFRTGQSLGDITRAQQVYFMQWVEHYTADTLANMYATTAGIDLLGFTDSKSAMTYWELKARRYLENAIDLQGGVGGEVLRS